MKSSEADYYEHAHSLLINNSKNGCPVDLYQIERLKSTINIIPNDVKVVIDIGSHCGTFLNMLNAKSNILAFGLERSSAAINIAKDQYKVTIVRGDAGALPFSNNSADAVCALQVIEHLPYNTYNNALDEMERVARKYIIISIPFNENRWYVFCPYCGCRFSAWYHFHTDNRSDVVSLLKNFYLKNICYVNPRMELIGSKFLRKIYRFLSRRFPPNAVCPACGYKEEYCSHETFYQSFIYRLIKSRLHIIPKKLIYVRAICLYERTY